MKTYTATMTMRQTSPTSLTSTTSTTITVTCAGEIVASFPQASDAARGAWATFKAGVRAGGDRLILISVNGSPLYLVGDVA